MRTPKKIMFKVKKDRTKKTRKPKLLDMKHIGQEPAVGIVIKDEAASELISAMNWYNYFYEVDDAKAWLLAYMKDVMKVSDQRYKKVKSLSTNDISRSLGTLAYLIQERQWTLPVLMVNRLHKKIDDLSTGIAGTEAPTAKVINLQERTLNRAKEVAYGLLDEEIDNFYNDNTYTFSTYDLLTREKASSQACALIKARVKALIAELDQEGYDTMTKRAKARYVAFFNGISDDVDRFQMNTKAVKVRKPRTIKAKPASKLTENVKYQKEYVPLKLVSVSPETIVGAETLWMFNTKYKTLTVLHAKDSSGLSVKGTTVINFDETKSVSKRIRKPEEATQAVLTAGKISLRKLMDQYKTTKLEAKGRIGADTILLRVIKT